MTLPAARRRRLLGQVALITGIGGGQGREAALAFARAGATVAGCDLKVEGTEETERLAAAEGLRVEGYAPVDLGDAARARAWVAEASARLGGFDILYNNAGAAHFASISELRDDAWHEIVRNELDLVFYTCGAAWRQLVERGGGTIINTASICGTSALPSSPGSFAHAATKGGVIALTRELALQGGPHGIRANSLSPGPVWTPANEHRMRDPEVRERHLGGMMLTRLGEPRDTAAAALFLASPESGWITGTNLILDGGFSAR